MSALPDPDVARHVSSTTVERVVVGMILAFEDQLRTSATSGPSS
jgi:hypothetical protein